MDLFSLQGKTVILTGGCGNLGRTMARHLLDYGAMLVIADISEQVPAELADAAASGRLLVLACDLSRTDSVKVLFQTVYDRCGHLDVLINNAAYGGGAGGKGGVSRIDEIDDDTWNTGIDGSLGVTFRCTREILPWFERNPGGTIVNIASMYGMIAPDFSIYGDTIPASPPFYGAGKAGVIQFTRYCASQLAPRGIRVNVLTPGPFPSITPATDQAFLSRLQNKTMLKRTGNANDLAGALILLASDASGFMTGANVVVDGGMTAL